MMTITTMLIDPDDTPDDEDGSLQIGDTDDIPTNEEGEGDKNADYVKRLENFMLKYDNKTGEFLKKKITMK